MSAPLSSNYPRSGRSQSPALALAERASKQDRAEVERLRAVLRTISELPMPEQDNMLSANMRAIARQALTEGAK